MAAPRRLSRKELFNLAESKNNTAFLVALATYPDNTNDLNIGSDIDFLGSRKILLEVVAENLSAECCRELMRKVGKKNTLNALNAEHGSFGPNKPSINLLRICRFQSYNVISELFNTFNIHLEFPYGKDTFNKAINENSATPPLTPQQKSELIKLAENIYDVARNPKQFASDHPKEFIKFYQQHLLEKIPVPILKKKEKEKWLQDNKPLITGLRKIASSYEVTDENHDLFAKLFFDLARIALLEDEPKKACNYWRMYLDKCRPSLHVKVDPQCIDYLLHKPNLFEPHLSKGQCMYRGIFLALQNPGEHLEMHLVPDDQFLFAQEEKKKKDEKQESKDEKQESKDEAPGDSHPKKEPISLDDEDLYGPLPEPSVPINYENYTARLNEAIQIMIAECITQISSESHGGRLFSPRARQIALSGLDNIQTLARQEGPEGYLSAIQEIALKLISTKVLPGRTNDILFDIEHAAARISDINKMIKGIPPEAPEHKRGAAAGRVSPS